MYEMATQYAFVEFPRRGETPDRDCHVIRNTNTLRHQFPFD